MRLIRSTFRASALCVALVVVLLLAGQHAMIYHPRPYPAWVTGPPPAFPEVTRLVYSTGEGPQQSYYLPARSAASRLPRHLWVLFCGNSGLALEWMPFVLNYPGADDAFLIMDYPGFGACAGSASSRTVRESFDAALSVLAKRLACSEAELAPRLRVLGHSIGSAYALVFASAHPVSKVVLVSPFTALRDMARRSVGWPLCYLLCDNLDNRSRLKELAARVPKPRISILFGSLDMVIPSEMGQELSHLAPGCQFELLPGLGHNDIVTEGAPKIYTVMMAETATYTQ